MINIVYVYLFSCDDFLFVRISIMKTNMNINSNRCSFVSPNIVNAEFSVSDEKKIKLKTSL